MLTLLHGALAVVSSVSLAAELDLLLHLIALPPGTTCKPPQGMMHQQRLRFPTGAVAALYAAQVLSLSGGQPCFRQNACPISQHELTLDAVMLDHLVTADVFGTNSWCSV